MKSIVFVILLSTVSGLVFGQSYRDRFDDLFAKNDTVKTRQLLAEWEKANPNDPDLYTRAINFYFANSKEESLSIDQVQTGKQSLQLTDSTGKVSGYLNSDRGYRSDQLVPAINYIDKGIVRFPNRLDMRFGKCGHHQILSRQY